MDALALLCTLHADGPSTLARLRAADCTTIERVASESPGRLAELMRTSALAAARFQREAHNLIERLGAEVGAVALVAARETVETRSNPLARVLSTWRERDEAEAMEAAAEPEAALPSGTCARVPAGIEVGAVDGIDGESSAALARAGIGDLGALARCDALAVAHRSGLSYSRIMRLRALAKRAAGPVARVEPSVQVVQVVQGPPADAPKLSPAEMPADRLEPLVRFERNFVLQPLAHAVDAGGPFA